MKALALALYLSLPAAAADLTVGPSGSGATFTSLSAAVTAAAPGDRILVAAGLYQEPGSIQITKPVTILGDGPLFTTVELAAGDVHIRNLLAGETLELVGIAFVPSAGKLWLESCQGPVVLSNCTVTIPQDGIAPAIDIDHCDQVVLDVCRTYAYYHPASYVHMAALAAYQSTVYVSGGDYDGPRGDDDSGGAGILAESSTVHLAGARVYGGRGGVDWSWPIYPHPEPGGAGVEAIDSQVLLRGGVYAGIYGGDGADADWGSHGTNYAKPGAGILLDATSSLSMTPDAVVVGSSNPKYAAIHIDGLGTVVTELEERAVISADTRTPAPGDTVTLRYEGEPGSAAIGFLAPALVPPYTLTGVIGPVQLDHATALVLPTELLDGTGQVLTTLDVPPWAFLVGETYVLQLLAASPGGELSVSSPLLVGIVP